LYDLLQPKRSEKRPSCHGHDSPGYWTPEIWNIRLSYKQKLTKEKDPKRLQKILEDFFSEEQRYWRSQEPDVSWTDLAKRRFDEEVHAVEKSNQAILVIEHLEKGQF
jgi:hypothetical protein